jgi:hypothetical protein
MGHTFYRIQIKDNPCTIRELLYVEKYNICCYYIPFKKAIILVFRFIRKFILEDQSLFRSEIINCSIGNYSPDPSLQGTFGTVFVQAVNTLTNASCKISLASSLSPLKDRQIRNIVLKYFLYSNFWDLLLFSRQPFKRNSSSLLKVLPIKSLIN